MSAEREEDIAAAAFLSDMNHQFDPFRVVVKQLEILVDDDKEDGDGLQISPGETHFLVLVRVTCPGILKKPISAGNFTVDRLSHPFREMPVIFTQIRQRTRNMWQSVEILSG